MEAWIAVIGTLAGAVIGAGGTWLIERERREHEREGRWLDQRRIHYANVLRRADDYTEATIARAHMLGLAFAGGMEKASIPPPMSETEFERADHETELIVSPSVEFALVFLRASLWLFVDLRYPTDAGAVSGDIIAKARTDYTDARSTFLKAARRDLLTDATRPKHPGRWRLRLRRGAH